MIPYHRLRSVAAGQPHPLLFATISGAHLYGFPSPNSDIDLRGAHVLPLEQLVGLVGGVQTIEVSEIVDEYQIDLVTHEVGKFFSLLLKPNGYVLEQLYSPLVVFTTAEHEELRAIAHGCLTRRHAHHYLGFARTQWDLFSKNLHVKTLLYLYRVLLTGIHLMRTGAVEASLTNLNAEYKLPQIPALIERKTSGTEQAVLVDADIHFHEHAYHRLVAVLEAAALASPLPDKPSARDELNDLLVRLHLHHAQPSGMT